jgi:hypothetical protein
MLKIKLSEQTNWKLVSETEHRTLCPFHHSHLQSQFMCTSILESKNRWLSAVTESIYRHNLWKETKWKDGTDIPTDRDTPHRTVTSLLIHKTLQVPATNHSSPVTRRHEHYGPHLAQSHLGTCSLGELLCLKSLLDSLCGLVVRVLGYRSGGPGSIPGTTRKKKCSGSRTGCTQPREYNWGATW